MLLLFYYFYYLGSGEDDRCQLAELLTDGQQEQALTLLCLPAQNWTEAEIPTEEKGSEAAAKGGGCRGDRGGQSWSQEHHLHDGIRLHNEKGQLYFLTWAVCLHFLWNVTMCSVCVCMCTFAHVCVCTCLYVCVCVYVSLWLFLCGYNINVWLCVRAYVYTVWFWLCVCASIVISYSTTALQLFYVKIICTVLS